MIFVVSRFTLKKSRTYGTLKPGLKVSKRYETSMLAVFGAWMASTLVIFGAWMAFS